MLFHLRRFFTIYILGKHFCEEFTQWEKKTRNYARVANPLDPAILQIEGHIEYTAYWQERKCTVCGRIYQEELEH